jgi:nucleotide-binding universal stress UspA family protein
MRLQTILVPVDFSPCAYEVTSKATSLAQRFDATVVLLHVNEPPSGLTPEAIIQPQPDAPPLTVERWMQESAQRNMHRFEALVKFQKVPHEVIFRPGPVARAILDAAAEVHADMIVMGTHGREGLSRFLLGSVAEEVIRHADAPVLTVRSHHHEGCEARSCAWCTEDVSPPEVQLRAELDG